MQSMLSSILRQGNPLSDLNKGLVLYLDGTYDAVNGWFVDKSGNGNHGTPYNGATTGTGVVGDGMSFDGVDDHLDCGNDSSLKPTTGLTLCGWANSDDWSTLSNERIMSCTQSGGWQLGLNESSNIYGSSHDNIFIVNCGGTYYFTKYDVNGLSSGYHYFVGTFDGQYLKLYIDGINDYTKDIGTSGNTIQYTYNNNVIIAAEAGGTGYAGTNEFDGNLDEIRIYDRALTANEVKALYRLKRP